MEDDSAAFGPTVFWSGDDGGRSSSDGRLAAGASDDVFHPAASSAAAKSSGNNGSSSFGALPLMGVSTGAEGGGLAGCDVGARAARAARSSAAVFGGAGFGRSVRTKGAGGVGARWACGPGAAGLDAAGPGIRDAVELGGPWEAAAGDGAASGGPA